MTLLKNLKTAVIGLFKKNDDNKWWVEIITKNPKCTYYFGDFENVEQARAACPGYIEDLKSEGAMGIKATLKRCNPEVLTIYDEEDE